MEDKTEGSISSQKPTYERKFSQTVPDYRYACKNFSDQNSIINTEEENILMYIFAESVSGRKEIDNREISKGFVFRRKFADKLFSKM